MRNNRSIEITFFPFDVTVEVASGTLIWEAIKQANLPLKASCGNEGTCGECLVRIIEGKSTAPPTASLPQKLIELGYVLACQTQITQNLKVELPAFQELAIKSIAEAENLASRKDQISAELEPAALVKITELNVPAASLANNSSDLSRLEREFFEITKKARLNCRYSVLKKLADTIRAENGKVQIVYLDAPDVSEIMDIFPASQSKIPYGIACDIGTTTVAIHLVDFSDGLIKATATSLNQQLKCGEDIIARINYAQKSAGLKELHELIILTLNRLIDSVTQETGISPADIYSVSVSGNTTMTHLFLGLDPRFIREEPYVPTFNRVPQIAAKELGLATNAEAVLFCAPTVGSYVGGDITAGLLSTPMLKDSHVSLFIDAGTNGELVVGNKDWLMTCACSAGPAFEGSGIKCGMPASEGAIEKIAWDGSSKIKYQVIGATKPKGICGSGLVDLLSLLFIHGYIDRDGKFKTQTEPDRVRLNDNGRYFLVETGENSYWGKDIIITERDITNLIRTKGAIFSACALLLKNVGLDFESIHSVYIAGGFGKHLNIENAISIGLLPDLNRNRFVYLGNSSLQGAYLILLSEINKEKATQTANSMTYVELNTEPQYMNEFTGSLFLPHTNMELFPSIKQILEKEAK